MYLTYHVSEWTSEDERTLSWAAVHWHLLELEDALDEKGAPVQVVKSADPVARTSLDSLALAHDKSRLDNSRDKLLPERSGTVYLKWAADDKDAPSLDKGIGAAVAQLQALLDVEAAKLADSLHADLHPSIAKRLEAQR